MFGIIVGTLYAHGRHLKLNIVYYVGVKILFKCWAAPETIPKTSHQISRSLRYFDEDALTTNTPRYLFPRICISDINRKAESQQIELIMGFIEKTQFFIYSNPYLSRENICSPQTFAA